ncbi:MAG TPA: alpha-amylase family glycosyl hydrolase [Solirubrobacteraceae bacterium]|nr:alpha-amylase family glycosyl hydrolase [Solirubrobacteraceae bacterium]
MQGILRWWQRGAVYQVYPRSFADSDGDGVGDLPGVRARLGHLEELGVEALWLSPFYPSPMADFGYDVADYCDVDPRFGTLADFDALVADAHGRGMRVVVDWVPNHSSDRHPWFVDSRAGRDSARRSWYVWRSRPPNAWRTQFRRDASAWSRDGATGDWYLHSFLPQQPDLNWDEPQVERAMHDTLRFWLARGVDGFRIDVVYRIAKDPALGENEPDRRHDQDWPTIHPRLRAIRALLEEFGPDRMAVGELYLPSQREIAAYVTSGDELHMAHNFFLLAQPWDAAAYLATIGEWLDLLEPGAWPAWCLGNHDHPRIATRLGPRRARVAAVLLVTLRGTPFIYQGDELGLPDVPIPAQRAIDPDGRDPERAPMPWEPPSRAGAGAGFTSGEPWLPITPQAERLNAATQAADPRSSLALYRALLALRVSEPALQRGTQRWLEPGDDLLAFERRADETTVIVLANFAPARREVRLAGTARIELDSGMARPRGDEVDLGSLALGPDEALVLRRC